MNLNDKQKQVVQTTKNKVLVQAAPASGKTACLNNYIVIGRL